MIQDYPTEISSMEFDAKWKAMNELPAGPDKVKERQRLQQYRPKMRMYAGRGREGASLLELADGLGRTRLKLVVDPLGEARIEFLNESGKVTHRFPEASKRSQ